MDTQSMGEALVINVPDALPVTRAKRRKKPEQAIEVVSEVPAEPSKDVEVLTLEQIAEGLKPLVPYLYKSIGFLQVALFAKKYPTLDKSKISAVLSFDDMEVESLTDPTARVLAKRASFLSRWPDEFSLLIILLTLYQVKFMMLSELAKQTEQTPSTEVVQ